MTKETYFEMCEMLGSEPLESEIPLELEDFPDLVQQVFVIYNTLADIWDPMGGNYLGKDYGIVFNLFELYDLVDREEKLLAMEVLRRIDYTRSKLISEKQKANKPAG